MVLTPSSSTDNFYLRKDGNVKQKGRRFTRLLFVVPVAVYLVFLLAYPMGFSFWLSFRSFGLKSLITGISKFVGFDNIVSVLGDPNFALAAKNTLYFTITSMVIQYIIGLALALFFYN